MTSHSPPSGVLSVSVLVDTHRLVLSQKYQVKDNMDIVHINLRLLWVYIYI